MIDESSLFYWKRFKPGAAAETWARRFDASPKAVRAVCGFKKLEAAG